MNSNLDRRNITIGDHRTSICLEAEVWDALGDICQREGLSLHQLCSLIEERRQGGSRTSAIRAFTVTYFRSAATEEGHEQAGHGCMAGDMVEIGLPGRLSVPGRRGPSRTW